MIDQSLSDNTINIVEGKTAKMDFSMTGIGIKDRLDHGASKNQ